MMGRARLYVRLSCTALLCIAALACAPNDRPSVASEGFERALVEGLHQDSEGKPVLMLREKGERGRRLPIWIGSDQARSIAFALEDISPLRPNTHDLIVSLLGGMGRSVSRVLVTELRDGTYYAVIEIERGIHVDSRPSDAIALAVRLGVPIFVADEVFSASGTDLGNDGPSIDI